MKTKAKISDEENFHTTQFRGISWVANMFFFLSKKTRLTFTQAFLDRSKCRRLESEWKKAGVNAIKIKLILLLHCIDIDHTNTLMWCEFKSKNFYVFFSFWRLNLIYRIISWPTYLANIFCHNKVQHSVILHTKLSRHTND